MPLLEVRNLRTHFFTSEGVVKAVDGASFTLERGETLGLVGESGSGKSMTALSILGLIDPPGRIVGGEILLNGEDLLQKSEKEMLHIRGKRIAMIFQEASASLNPTLTVGKQIFEALKVDYYDTWRRGFLRGLFRAFLHMFSQNGKERETAIELLKRVELPSPELRVDEFPYMMSGGMKQRIMIAIALAGRPEILIADEPTTALDVTIQAQILQLLQERRDEFGLSIILITHDLGIAAEMCDKIAIMYAGRIVEYAPVEQIFNNPQHPYTVGLLQSIHSIDSTVEELEAIPGSVPSLIGLRAASCYFCPRCAHTMEVCESREPAEVWLNTHQMVKCHLYDPKVSGP